MMERYHELLLERIALAMESQSESLATIAEAVSHPPVTVELETMEPEAPSLSVPEVAELLATTERHVRGLMEREGLPFYRVGRLIRFRESELSDWLMGRRRSEP